MSETDCIVIGAGVVGLAVARALAETGREVIIVEQERQIGLHTSSRNSEVIHAGIHYPPGSLKASSCVAGREALYAYCVARGIAHRRCGKLTVATDTAGLDSLQRIERQARAAGVSDLEWLDADQVRALEPELRCHAALLSPSTGIIDSGAYLKSLLADAEQRGAQLATGTRVTALRAGEGGIGVCIDGAGQPAVHARLVVNCAALGAVAVAASMPEFPRTHLPRAFFAKGSYFALPGRSPFAHLVYPVPAAAGHLGIHLTLDLSGAARFGPDLEWVPGIDYRVDAHKAGVFEQAIRDYWPGLPSGVLLPAYAGVRPKIAGPGEPPGDFVISGPREHGVPGLVHLFGIESPGLTASLALAEHVAGLAGAGPVGLSKTG